MLFTIYQFHVHIIMSISFTLTVNPVKLSSTVQYHAKQLYLNQYHVSTVIYTHTITVNHSIHWLLILWLQLKILVHCPGESLYWPWFGRWLIGRSFTGMTRKSIHWYDPKVDSLHFKRVLTLIMRSDPVIWPEGPYTNTSLEFSVSRITVSSLF